MVPRNTLVPRLFLMIVLAACSTPAPRPSGEPTIRVEDGVTIVENPGLEFADSLAWHIDTTRAIRIGMLDGPDEYVIGRLAGTLFLPNGQIVIADATTNDLRIFDDSGKFVRRIGRKGEGPGEFTWLTDILPYSGDSIIVMDHESSRANVLGPDFAYGRRFRPRLLETLAKPPMTSHSLVGFFANGRAFISDYLSACDRQRREGGFCVDSVAFFATNEEGETQGRFGRFVYQRHEGYRVGPGHSTGWLEPHPQAIWALHEDRFYYSDSQRFEILVYTADGKLERRIRVAHTAPRYEKDVVWPRRTTQHDLKPEVQKAMAVLDEAQAKAVLPDTFPSFSDLLVDAEGNIWVREYSPRGPDRPAPRWFIFDAQGVLRWSLRSPPGMIRFFRPYVSMGPQILSDRVLATARDPDGVESVVVYQINKRQP